MFGMIWSESWICAENKIFAFKQPLSGAIVLVKQLLDHHENPQLGNGQILVKHIGLHIPNIE